MTVATSPTGAKPAGGSGAEIAVSDLTKTYKGDVKALRGVSFDVAPGTVFGLLGPNGAGKSTTVKILTTLSRADSGTASVGGVDVAARPDKVRRIIGCVPQQSACDVDATGFENLALQGQLYGLHGRELRSRANELLEQFGLATAAERIAKTYSGGMQRKLDVAMGLMHRPQVLFLDEPTTGLDPQARADMWTEISRLARQGLTVLLTTHYLEEADNLGDDLAIVDNGVVVARGTPEELKSELRGDAVAVEFANDPDAEALRRCVAALELREVTIDGRDLRGRADNGAAALPGVLVALEGAGFRVASATVARPSLDDVYLRHTGHAYEATGAKTTKTAKADA